MPSRDKCRVLRLSPVHRMCLDAMLLGAALLLSYLEAVLPLDIWIPLPGFKLGLANVLVTLAFVLVSPSDAAGISLCRIVLMGMLFGNASAFWFSLCGGILSYMGLWLLVRFGRRLFSMVGVSVGCAALHNVGQLAAAGTLFGFGVVYSYLPILLLASLIFGTVTGLLLQVIVPRLEQINMSMDGVETAKYDKK